MILKILEFIFPYLERASREDIEKSKKRLSKYEKKKTVERLKQAPGPLDEDALLHVAEELFNDEDRRAETAERKAALVLSSAGIIVALLTGFMNSIFRNENAENSTVVVAFMMFLVVGMYFSVSIFHAIRVLRVKGFRRLLGNDLVQAAESGSEKLHLIGCHIENRMANINIIDEKVSHVELSIRHFQRAVFVTLLSGLLLLILKMSQVELIRILDVHLTRVLLSLVVYLIMANVLLIVLAGLLIAHTVTSCSTKSNETEGHEVGPDEKDPN